MASPGVLPVAVKPFKLHGLDHLRTLAITLVLLYHYRMFNNPAWMNEAVDFGWTGVDLFFVLSGYLIASQLFLKISMDGRFSLSEFVVKRFFRIIPAYLVVLSVYVLLPSFREREGLAPLWKYLTFTHNFGLDLSKQGTFSHAWSLCIEEQFYLLLPLVLMGLLWRRWFRRAGWILLLLLLGGLLCRYLIYVHQVAPYADEDSFWIRWYQSIYYPTYNRLDGLLAGVALAALFRFRPLIAQQIQRFGNWLLVAGLVVLVAAWFIVAEQSGLYASVIGYPVVSLGYVLLVAGAVSPRSVLHRFNSPITSRIASWSYGIYLSHKIVIHLTQVWLERLGMKTDTMLVLGICIVACVLTAWLLNVIVEKPFLKLRDQILTH